MPQFLLHEISISLLQPELELCQSFWLSVLSFYKVPFHELDSASLKSFTPILVSTSFSLVVNPLYFLPALNHQSDADTLLFQSIS
jgi:hypothetical protein